MDRNKLTDAIRAYFSNSQYHAPNQEDSLQSYPYRANPKYAGIGLESDKYLLQEILIPSPSSYSSMAGQIFGQQALKERLGLKQLIGLLTERYQMHSKHLSEIKRRNMKCQEQLCVARLNSKLDGGRNALFQERLLLDLEEKQRQEELDFWKDTSEIRQKILERGSEYSATRRRASWLHGLEGEENVYVSE